MGVGWGGSGRSLGSAPLGKTLTGGVLLLLCVCVWGGGGGRRRRPSASDRAEGRGCFGGCSVDQPPGTKEQAAKQATGDAPRPGAWTAAR